ncbi:MAG: rod shape-determining protein MreC [Thermoleophilia bacterium]|nr:rod shape-determining protein MreC [Thermoleophilia bacterium]
MRSPFFTTKRRSRRTTASSTLAKPRRNAPPPVGGPVASAEYIGRGRRRAVGATARARGGGVLPRPHSTLLVRRAVLALLICAAFGLITASYRGGVAVHSAQMQVLHVVAPIQRGMSRAWDPIAAAWNWTGDLFHATSENPKLVADNEQLRTQLHALKTVEADNADMRAQLNFEGSTQLPGNLTKVHGHVIGRVPGSAAAPLVIDVGTKSGVQKDDPVLGTGGLIGIVTQVNASQAVVGLIIGSAQSVGARVANSTGIQEAGVLQAVSSDGAPALRLTSVGQAPKVSKGDEIVTSGFFDPRTQLASKYPRNLPIGTVSDVGNSPGDLSKTIQVTPYADFANISAVLVLTKGDVAR